MLRVFIVSPENYGYDQFDEVSVVAQDEAQAIELAQSCFDECQGKLSAEEVDLTSPGFIVASFCAG